MTEARFMGEARGLGRLMRSGSACIGAGEAGGNLGASEVALKIAKEWLAKDLT